MGITKKYDPIESFVCSPLDGDGYRFLLDGKVTAILDPNGVLSLRDGGSLEKWASWKDYVREVMLSTPVKVDSIHDILEQLSMTLGDYEEITKEVRNTNRPSTTKETEMSDETKATKAVKTVTAKKVVAKKEVKKAVKKVKEAVVMNECKCGCKKMVAKNFAPGHDARVHGWAKKIDRKEMKWNEIPDIAQKYIRAHAAAA